MNEVELFANGVFGTAQMYSEINSRLFFHFNTYLVKSYFFSAQSVFFLRPKYILSSPSIFIRLYLSFNTENQANCLYSFPTQNSYHIFIFDIRLN